MTSLTQATSLSPDPVMREAEIKAMRDDILNLHNRAREFHAIAKGADILTPEGGETAVRYALDEAAIRKYADRLQCRLQHRLDELERGQ